MGWLYDYIAMIHEELLGTGGAKELMDDLRGDLLNHSSLRGLLSLLTPSSMMFWSKLIVLLVVVTLNASVQAAPIPAGKPPNYPGWWFEQEVIKQRSNPPLEFPQWGMDHYLASDDYATLNQGQLKNFANSAYLALQAVAPGVLGPELTNLISGFRPKNLTRTAGVIAAQSSTYTDAGAAHAENAIDGNTDGHYWHGSVTSTNAESDPWWQVDLGSLKKIHSVDVWNRTDGSGERLVNFYVFVSRTDMSQRSLSSLLGDAAVWRSPKIASAPAPSSTTQVPAVAGQFVMVRIEGAQYLHLAEVSVTGFDALDATRAPGVTATQSSMYTNEAASRAIDRNTDGNIANRSVSITALNVDPWWQVNLKSLRTIDTVELWNRTDGTGERLTNFYVFVSPTDMSTRSLNALLADASVWKSSKISTSPSPLAAIPIPAISGQYVMVRIQGTQYLQLAEVFVRGRAVANDYSPANLGQLKNISKPFYDRFERFGYPSLPPWESSLTPADDFAIANLGQAKNVFSLDITGFVDFLDKDDGADNLPDWWQSAVANTGLPFSHEDFGSPAYNNASAFEGVSPSGSPSPINSILFQEDLFQSSMVGRDSPPPPALLRIINPPISGHYLDRTACTVQFAFPDEYRDHIEGFTVYKKIVSLSQSEGGTWEEIAALSQSAIEFRESGLRGDERYYYRITVRSEFGESAPSNDMGYSPPLDPWARFAKVQVHASSIGWLPGEVTGSVVLTPATFGWYTYENQDHCFWTGLSIDEIELDDVTKAGFENSLIDELPDFGQEALEDIGELSNSAAIGGNVFDSGGCHSVSELGSVNVGISFQYRMENFSTPSPWLHIASSSVQAVRYRIETNPGTEFKWNEVFNWPLNQPVQGAKLIARRLSNGTQLTAAYEITPRSADLSLAGIGLYTEEDGVNSAQCGLISDVDLVVDPVLLFGGREQSEWPDAFEADPRLYPVIRPGESMRVRIRYFSTFTGPMTQDTRTRLVWDDARFNVFQEHPFAAGLPPTLLTSGSDLFGNAELRIRVKSGVSSAAVFSMIATGFYRDIELGQDAVNLKVGEGISPDSYTGPNYRFPFEEATGAQHRKIALNGRPLADSKPQSRPESDDAAEETFIDALTLGLRHSTTDIYVPIPGADFAVEAKRVATSEVWTTRSGLRPHERPDRPFGAGWTSNLGAGLEHVIADEPDGPEDVYVTAHNGITYHFIRLGGVWIPKATGRHERWIFGTTLNLEVRQLRVEAVEGIEQPSVNREVWVLRAGKGTEILFEGADSANSPMVPVMQRIVGRDRERGSSHLTVGAIKSTRHNFYRTRSVADRFGNKLIYHFEGKPSLVPTRILVGRVGSFSLTLKLSISQNQAGRITDLWDANGNRWKYEYDTSAQYTPPNTPNFTYQESSLKKIIGPDDNETAFRYEFIREDDTFEPRSDDEKLMSYWHLNLNGILTPGGKEFAFIYRPDHTKESFDSSVGYFTQAGRSRCVETIHSPEGSALFSNRPPDQPSWAVRVGYNAVGQFQNVNSPARYTRVEDAEGKIVTYTWGDSLPLPLVGISSNTFVAYSTALTICYKQMIIDYGALGSEKFRFNETAGLALSESVDLSGNVTKFYQEDLIGPIATPFGSALIPVAEETTKEISAIGGTSDPLNGAGRTGERLFKYKSILIGGQSCRFLEKITEEGGRTTEYTMDEKGRTKVETRTGPQGGSHETHFYYENANYPGAVTKREVKRNAGDTTIPTPLVTDFILNGNGQVRVESVSLGSRALVTHHTYDDNGNRLSTTDANGHLTGFSYDSRNRLIKVEYPGKFTKLFAYDGRGNKVSETDENGNVTSYTYDGVNRLLLEDREGAVTQFTYNKVGSRVSVTNPRGNVTTTDYDDLQRPVKVTDPLMGTTSYKYGMNSGGRATDAEGFKPTKITDARGRVTEFEYDKVYRQIRKWNHYKLGATAEWKTFYDAVGNVVKETDPERANGAERISTKKEYDGANRLKKVIFADLSEEEYFYNSVGLKWKTLIRTIANPAGFSTVTGFDGAGRAVTATAPSVLDEEDVARTPVTTTGYDDVGNITSVTDPLLQTTTFIYDGRNRKVAEVRPAVQNGGVGPLVAPPFCYAYDAVGNVVATRDANESVTFNAYDQWNRLIVVERPGNGGRVFTGYDGNGNVVDVTDGNGHQTLNVYDALDRLRSTTDAHNITVSYEYDAVGNRTKITDGRGQQSLFAYQDGLNRNTSITYPVSVPVSFVYDGVNKVQRIDSEARVTNYTYDLRNRLRTVTYIGRSVDDRVYTHDDFGNLLTVTEANKGGKADVAYTYDALRRVLTETSGGITHTYKYDVAGNRRRTIYGSGGPTLVSTYDVLNRLSTVTEGTRGTSYTYDLNGNVVHKELPNHDTVTTLYDKLNRAEKITGRRAPANGQPGILHYSYDMAYDPVGNLVRSTEAYGSQIPSRTLLLDYDAINRLKMETSSHGGVTEITSFVYDAANNRVRKEVKVGGGAPVTTYYVHNKKNQLTSYSGGGIFTYDLNGNRATRVLNGQTDTYTYDYENRLVRYAGANSQGVAHFEYAYDYRTRRVEVAPAGTAATKVIFSGGTSVREMENAATTVQYVRGSDYGGGIGGILYTLRNSTPSYTHYDGRGDVTTKTNGSGAITWQATYEAFGKRTREEGSTLDKQKANTKYEDPTGLLNEGFRYRDLETGSFITRDPAGFIDGPNLYTYVRQNPWSKFDPEGLNDHPIVANRKALIDAMRDSGMDEAADQQAQLLQRGQQWAGEFADTADTVVSLTPQGGANEALGGKDAKGESIGKIGQFVAFVGMVSGPATKAAGKLLQGAKKLIGLGESALDIAKKNQIDLDNLAKQDALRDMRAEGIDLDPVTGEFRGGEGVIYKVPGSGTKSGKPYIGSADDDEVRAATARDGRDRSQREKIGSFPRGNQEARRIAEQEGIEDNGGLPNLDNRRNEIRKKND